MTEETNLNARNTDPDTSHEAARTFSKRVRARVENIFINHIKVGLGLTDEELEHVYYQLHQGGRRDSPRKRRSDLTRDGLLVDSGLRRPSNCGRAMIVWIKKVTLEQAIKILDREKVA
jgi:hypothetical protein